MPRSGLISCWLRICSSIVLSRSTGRISTLAGHQGDHKKRAKYRFASKTIMRILPPAKKTEVEGLIAANSMTMDLYEILGKCTWTVPK